MPLDYFFLFLSLNISLISGNVDRFFKWIKLNNRVNFSEDKHPVQTSFKSKLIVKLKRHHHHFVLNDEKKNHRSLFRIEVPKISGSHVFYRCPRKLKNY